MRRRINRRAICSSYNYAQSRIVHIKYIQEQHEQNKEEIEKIISNTSVAYVICFGKRIKISLQEAHYIETSIQVNYE